jgi:hypothetical protein
MKKETKNSEAYKISVVIGKNSRLPVCNFNRLDYSLPATLLLRYALIVRLAFFLQMAHQERETFLNLRLISKGGALKNIYSSTGNELFEKFPNLQNPEHIGRLF